MKYILFALVIAGGISITDVQACVTIRTDDTYIVDSSGCVGW